MGVSSTSDSSMAKNHTSLSVVLISYGLTFGVMEVSLCRPFTTCAQHIHHRIKWAF